MNPLLRIAIATLVPAVAAEAADRRTVVPLDGIWEAAEGGLASPPPVFDRTVPVPGLLDMASPPFESPGATVPLDQRNEWWRTLADPKREAFWYRRTFVLAGPVPEVARLKFHKAKYGLSVWLNGQKLGDHDRNFTPGWFDAKPALRGGGATNELIARVGASPAQSPGHRLYGFDFEKSRYIPGIYDSVELILSGAPHVLNIQAVPDLERKAVRALVELDREAVGPVTARVAEAAGGRVVAAKVARRRGERTMEADLPIRDVRLWSPEDPFLYDLVIETEGDTGRTRFGMRSFSADPGRGVVLLNGRPYYLRGSNVCIFRFFEDRERQGLPWNREWVRALHRRFKDMHWNSLRYCIGFPPELWYEIADEEGVLIQDEFPLWYGNRPENPWPVGIAADHLEQEYREWMRERWNHACVVVWDAQNETTYDRVISAAVARVRSLDLSGRPWDNGWGGDPASERRLRIPSLPLQPEGVSLGSVRTEGGRRARQRPPARARPPSLPHQRVRLAVDQPRRLAAQPHRGRLPAAAGRGRDRRSAVRVLCACAGREDGVLAPPQEMRRRVAFLRSWLLPPRRANQRPLA